MSSRDRLNPLCKAPWTDEEVANLKAFQKCGFYHAFMDGQGHALIPMNEGWVATAGGPVVQDWCQGYMLDGTAVECAMENFKLLGLAVANAEEGI
jgi:hypothetical protein